MTSENFSGHSIFEKLEQLKQVLSEQQTQELLGSENFHFFESALDFIDSKLKLTIPTLVQELELTSLSSEIESGTAQLNNYFGNNNVGYVTNAINNYYSAIAKARNLPTPITKTDFDFSRMAANFQKTIENAYKEIESLNTNLKNDLESTKENLMVANDGIVVLNGQLTSKEIEIQNVLNSFNSEFETLKVSNSTTLETLKRTFSDSIETDRKIFKTKIENDLEANLQSFEEQKDSLSKQSEEIIASLNKKLAEANKIVNIVGNVGVTGNYQNIANQHKQSANFFRWVALAFMVVMSALLIWSIIELSRGDFDLYKSLVRILAAAVLTYPAVYASRESNKHRLLETQNRNLELELASIGPFIELLPEDKKQKIKEELVSKYFGNHHLIVEKKEDEDISINGLEKLLKAILPFIKK
ncbi:hypothetical protein [Pedobacter psychrodurus]|uniref:hypothetical protein n=1 Tax=Pedobacter psychrodurus TaxID=2530456 RepID=UPI00292CEA1D|nr:hypothetical protein [Pedobacter psychrodurus]